MNNLFSKFRYTRASQRRTTFRRLPAIEARGLRHLIEEEAVARKYVVSRYQMLIDRKYVNGLSPSENEELESLKSALDAMDKPYYDAIIKRLRKLVEQRGV